MANPVLDPPRPVLRLVSDCADNGTAHAERGERDHRYRDSAVLGLQARRILRLTLACSMQERHGVNPDAVRVILATRQLRHAGPLTRFTTDDVWRLMMVDVLAWCRSRHLALPHGCAHALMVMIHALQTEWLLDTESDSVTDLAYAISECTGEHFEALPLG